MKQTPVVHWSPELQQQHLRWNYKLLIADGATYTAGMAFMAAESITPNMIQDLGGPDWMIALSPSFLMLGSMITPLFVVHHIEKLDRYRPFTLQTSYFQRSVPLLAAAGLYFGWDYCPGLSFLLAAFSLLFIGMISGLNTTAFWELFSKLLPPNRRSSNSAWRYSIGLLVGIGAGYTISRILHHFPGRNGYALLLTLQGLFLWLSGLWFSMLREEPNAPAEARPHRGLWEVLRDIPEVLRSQHDFRLFLLFRSLGQAHVVLIPFLALFFRRQLGLGDNFLGYFVQAQMFGGLLGNALAGYWGDRYGAKLPLITSRFCALALCLIAVLATNAPLAIGCFFLLGLVININQTSEATLILELAPPDKRPVLLAMQSILLMPVLILFGFLSKWLYRISDNITWEALAAAILLAISLLLLFRLREPREEAAE